MKYFFDIKSFRNLKSLLTFLPKNVKKIYAAIAFTHSDLLLKKCEKNDIELEWWGLLNSRDSTDLNLIKRAIKNNKVRFYPFAEYFHPKVILFEGFGLYIGSANMTRAALEDNVEAGIFIDEKEIENKEEIYRFFNKLRESSIPATIEDVEKIDQFILSTLIEKKEIETTQSSIDENFKESLGHLFLLDRGITDWEKTKKSRELKKEISFLQEWRETQNYISNVQELVIENCTQPNWVSRDAYPSIITDQLLHAYYYTYVLKEKTIIADENEKKSILKVNDSYIINKGNIKNAILEAIHWWEQLDSPPNDEDVHINIWGVDNRRILSKIKDNDLSINDFIKVMQQNHAARNHARQIKNRYFNLPDDFKANMDVRTEILSKTIFNTRTKKGLHINEVLRYLLFQETEMLERRVFNLLNNDIYKFDHFGKSIVGELLGWGRPDITHLRNNRVNKGLKCLGFNVRLFSE